MTIKKIQNFVRKNGLINPADKLLLTVSGGVDSMVMLDIFSHFPNEKAVVHCNFQLRGEESNKDEDLVVRKAREYGYPVFTKRFETEDYARKNHLSIQMAARELRYRYFEELADRHGYTKILTAHHLDDRIETFFIHLLRGSGPKGLQGIPVQRGRYIRPVLNISKKEILDYARENHIAYREDLSNASDKYLRNQIRHSLLPALEKIDPHYHKSLIQTMEYQKQYAAFAESKLEDFIRQHLTRTRQQYRLPLSVLKDNPGTPLILYHWLSDYGFTPDNLQNIHQHIRQHQAGKHFIANNHILLIDRKYLILSPVKKQDPLPLILRTENGKITRPLTLKWKTLDRTEAFKISADPLQAFLDKDKLKQPLIVRKWKEGDRFKPLGMTGMKKVSDFLIDKKINRIDKENIFVLTSGKEIAWIVGLQISDSFKIDENTKTVFHLQTGNPPEKTD